jgi:HAD superfamily hydrolase (TIGR01484 family)
VNKRPKLIATDLDGTIVSHKGVISQRTIDVFTRAKDMGVHVFFVTGRPPRWMGEIREAFGFGEAICCNGAMLYDLINDKVLEEWMISIELQCLKCHLPSNPMITTTVKLHMFPSGMLV